MMGVIEATSNQKCVTINIELFTHFFRFNVWVHLHVMHQLFFSKNVFFGGKSSAWKKRKKPNDFLIFQKNMPIRLNVNLVLQKYFESNYAVL